MLTDNDRNTYERYLNTNMGGVWFASSLPSMELFAKEKVAAGVLKPLGDIVPNKEVAKHWYIPINWTIHDLPKFFSAGTINGFGVKDY